ncbi:MAG TPA: hypothetical protein VIM02_01900 [Rhizomicrobium sp.]
MNLMKVFPAAVALGISALLSGIGTVTADDGPPPIRAFDVATIQSLGAAMYVQDQEAWKATDLLRAGRSDDDLKAAKMHGWIVEPAPQGDVVRFIRDGESRPEAYYDVTFRKDAAPVLSEPRNRALTADELAQYNARLLALKSIDRPCSDRYNTIALKDPQNDGWLVWTIASTTDPDAVIIGGHYRFTISSDGKTIRQKDALSHGCLTLSRKAAARAQEIGLLMNHLVSMTPVETHVFANLNYGIPLHVGTADGTVWKVDRGRLTVVDMDLPGADGFAARAIAGNEEQCHLILTKSVDGAPKFFVGGEVKVINPTERGETYVAQAPEGFSISGVACRRNDIVPAPNDYKVLAAGYVLDIGDKGAGHPDRLAAFELKGGHVELKIAHGDPLSADLSAKMQARLKEFEQKLPPAR